MSKDTITMTPEDSTATRLACSETRFLDKQARILERASRRTRLTWREKRQITKSLNENLFELTKRTGKAITEAVAARLESDLAAFVQQYQLQNLSAVRRIAMQLEQDLSAVREKDLAKAAERKAKILSSVSERLSSITLTSDPQDKYAQIALQAIDEMLKEVIKQISNTQVSIDTTQLFSFN